MPEGEIQKTVKYFPKGNVGKWSSLGQNKFIKNLGERKDSTGCVLQEWLEGCFSNMINVTSHEEPPASYTGQLVMGREYHHSLPAEPFSPQRTGVCVWVVCLLVCLLACGFVYLFVVFGFVLWADLLSGFCSFIRMTELQIVFHFCTVYS